MFIFKTVPEVCIRCLIDILLCVFYVPFHAKLKCHLEHECGWLAASMIQNCIRSENIIYQLGFGKWESECCH